MFWLSVEIKNKTIQRRRPSSLQRLAASPELKLRLPSLIVCRQFLLFANIAVDRFRNWRKIFAMFGDVNVIILTSVFNKEVIILPTHYASNLSR